MTCVMNCVGWMRNALVGRGFAARAPRIRGYGGRVRLHPRSSGAPAAKVFVFERYPAPQAVR